MILSTITLPGGDVTGGRRERGEERILQRLSLLSSRVQVLARVACRVPRSVIVPKVFVHNKMDSYKVFGHNRLTVQK